ncbi:MFS transporter [Chloroflexota bacterium]
MNQEFKQHLETKPRFFYGYVIVGACFIILGAMAGVFGSYGLFLKPLVEEFSWSRSMTSGAYSLSIFVYGFLGIIVGGLTDRFGPRLVVTIFSLLFGLGYLSMSQISSAWQLYLFFGLIVGIGRSGSIVPCLSTVARWFDKNRGFATGVTSAGIGIGLLVMPLVASHLIAIYGWSMTCIFIGVTTLIIMVVMAQFLRRNPGQTYLPHSEAGIKSEDGQVSAISGLTLRKAIHTKNFWIVCFISFALVENAMTIPLHIVPYVTDLGISEVVAASVLSITGAISSVGRIAMGSVRDRIGSKPDLIIVIITQLIALIWLQVAGNLWMFYLFAVIFGFGWGGGAIFQSPMIADLFGLRSHGAILGFVLFGGTVGGAIGPVLAGTLFDVTNSYKLAFLNFAAVTSIALILSLFIKMPRSSNKHSV